jgi:hypothetical protein
MSATLEYQLDLPAGKRYHHQFSRSAQLLKRTAKLLVGLASASFLGSESHGPHGQILLPGGYGSLQNGWLGAVLLLEL